MKAERFVGCACVLPLFGAVASGAASIDASRRSLESLVTTAGGARALHARGEVQMRSDLDSCKGFALNRFFDSTPVFLRFGKLTDLAGSARYLKKIELPGRPPKWTTISYVEWRKENPRLRQPTSGVVELFATRMVLGHASFDDDPANAEWEESCKVSVQEFQIPPRITERNTASCLHATVEKAVPSFSVESLGRWSRDVPDGVCVLSDVPDNHSANMRYKRKTAKDLPRNILYDAFS